MDEKKNKTETANTYGEALFYEVGQSLRIWAYGLAVIELLIASVTAVIFIRESHYVYAVVSIACFVGVLLLLWEVEI